MPLPCVGSEIWKGSFFARFERTVNRDNTVSFQNLSLQDPASTLASHTGGLHGGRASAPGWVLQASAMDRIAWGATTPRVCLGSVAIGKGTIWRSRAVEKSQSRLSLRLEIPPKERDSHFPTASTAAGD